MLSGHFSGSVVVTANLQKNMNQKSLLMVLKQSNTQWNWDNFGQNKKFYCFAFYFGILGFIWHSGCLPDCLVGWGHLMRKFTIYFNSKGPSSIVLWWWKVFWFCGPQKIILLLLLTILKEGKPLACLDAICAAVVLHKIQACCYLPRSFDFPQPTSNTFAPSCWRWSRWWG